MFDAEGNPQPPNNWSQILGETNSAWTYDQKSREYYLSLFTPEQPDLNWENEDVRAAVYDVMHFWLKRGVRGFRLDVINLISKDQSFPDAHAINDEKLQSGVEYYANGPRLHEFLKEMHEQVLSKYDVVTVGEMPWVDSEDEIIKIVGSNQRELNMIFIFDMVDIDAVRGEPRFSIRDWRVQELKQIINRWQRVMIERDGWNTLFLENHDNPRSVSRYVDDGDGLRERGAKFLAMMHFTLSGTLFLYQGQELGLRNVPKSWTPEDFKDIESVNLWKKYALNQSVYLRETLTRLNITIGTTQLIQAMSKSSPNVAIFCIEKPVTMRELRCNGVARRTLVSPSRALSLGCESMRTIVHSTSRIRTNAPRASPRFSSSGDLAWR